jgi:hypothetical protein
MFTLKAVRHSCSALFLYRIMYMSIYFCHAHSSGLMPCSKGARAVPLKRPTVRRQKWGNFEHIPHLLGCCPNPLGAAAPALCFDARASWANHLLCVRCIKLSLCSLCSEIYTERGTSAFVSGMVSELCSHQVWERNSLLAARPLNGPIRSGRL